MTTVPSYELEINGDAEGNIESATCPAFHLARINASTFCLQMKGPDGETHIHFTSSAPITAELHQSPKPDKKAELQKRLKATVDQVMADLREKLIRQEVEESGQTTEEVKRKWDAAEREVFGLLGIQRPN